MGPLKLPFREVYALKARQHSWTGGLSTGCIWMFYLLYAQHPQKNIAEHVNIVFVGAEQVPRTLLVLKKYQHPCGPFLIRHVVPEF